MLSRTLALSFVIIGFVTAAQKQGDLTAFLGEWRGESSCVVEGTACQNESVIFHIVKMSGRSNLASVAADKIVNGKAINMGTLDFQYDPDRQLLICEYSQGVWKLGIRENRIEGTLTRPDSSVLRRVTLVKGLSDNH